MGNHLWQSTVCVAIAGLLTLALRNNHARTRFGIWLAASVKFLIPFSLLIGMGSHLARPRVVPPPQPGFFLAMEEISQPFTPPAEAGSQTVERSRRPAEDAGLRYRLVHLLPAILMAIWLSGIVLVLFVWYARWRRISAALRKAVPIEEGREVEALRRAERLGGLRERIDLLLSTASLEPGVFGIVKPVLVWPKGISERFDDSQLEAILAHEVWHVRRRDNLTAVIHMVVEALFWFHPLVWWLTARLVDERERACDEEVLEMGSNRQVYAESVLKTCQFCVESPMVCVAGVAGADLKKRIVRIMTERVASKLSLGKKLLLSAASVAVVAAPVFFGLVNGPPTRAQSGQPRSGESAALDFDIAQNAAMQGMIFNGGVFVTPIPDAPFSALAREEITQILSDGTSFQRKSSGIIARNSQGIIHNESRQVMPATSTQEPGLLMIHLFDPNTKVNLLLNPSTHVARRRIYSNYSAPVPPANWAQHELPNRVLPPSIREEDLGTSVIEGIDVHGYRRTVTISEKVSGTGKPVNVVDAYWYSEELRLDLAMKHDDPRTGSLVIVVQNINVGEPAVELFEVPPEYKVVDMTPPAEEEKGR
jgi:beta-lactamase regulating signal transducer with metallopeptidase domain